MEDEYYCTGGEAEIREYHRKIDFGENAVKEKYNVLIPEYQEIVYRVLRELADGREYFGYNFSRFLKSYKKAEPSVSQLRISRLLLKILGDGVSTSEKEVNNRLDIAKKTIVIKKSADGQTSQIEDFVRDICNYFLIDTDLLEKGIGKVAYIKDEWDCKYRESDLFTGLTEDDISTSFDLRLHIQMYEKHLWEKIYKKSGQGRRTGVGITAEGDMLAAMGLRYGTEEATEFSEEVHKTIALEAYRSSVNMAKERGAFAIYDSEREIDNPFINRLKEADPELYEEMKKYGRRNIACLTIAPTGTTSLMTQTTSGIEPVFMPVYKRRRKVNPNDPQVHVDFVDETGDAFEEYIVFHHKFVEWMTVNGYDSTKRYTQEEIDELVEKSPYYKATSNDVDWLMKVKMQGRIQKWVDHSISVTINLPNDVDEALVNRLYVEAWRSGCKGCTVYRDGSRSGVLLSTKKDKKNKKEELLPCKPPTVVEVRPKILEAEVVRFQNNKEKWVAFVGLLDGHPYEIFTGLQDDEEGISLPKSVTTGRIIKNIDEEGNKRYDFQFENKRGYKTTIEGLSEKFNKEYWNYAKLISGVLRWRMPINRVIKLVDSLQLDSENINTWKNGVERALKKYVTDGTSAEGQKCPNCGNETLVYQEGCLICKTCGTSRCG